VFSAPRQQEEHAVKVTQQVVNEKRERAFHARVTKQIQQKEKMKMYGTMLFENLN